MDIIRKRDSSEEEVAVAARQADDPRTVPEGPAADAAVIGLRHLQQENLLIGLRLARPEPHLTDLPLLPDPPTELKPQGTLLPKRLPLESRERSPEPQDSLPDELLITPI